MTTPQPGIFALGARSHYHLELDVRPDATDDADRRGAGPAARTGGHRRAAPTSWSGSAPTLWRRLAPADAPAELHDFEPIDGLDGHRAPATQHDLWVWVHGTGEDIVLDVARAVERRPGPGRPTLRLEQPCFVYKDSRDLTGFIDGTANPRIDEAAERGARARRASRAPAARSCIAQRWVHDLAAFAELSVDDQQRVFGRTKPDSVELEGDAKPANAHISRVEIHDEAGEERPIFRRSTPYGTVEEAGSLLPRVLAPTCPASPTCWRPCTAPAATASATA